MARKPGGEPGAQPKPYPVQGSHRDQEGSAGHQRVVHLRELVLFVVAAVIVLVMIWLSAATPTVALVAVLALLFGTMRASRTEPATLGRGLARLVQRLTGGSGGA